MFLEQKRSKQMRSVWEIMEEKNCNCLQNLVGQTMIVISLVVVNIRV